MDNYEYIIASLPNLDKDGKGLSGWSEEEILDWVAEQCSARDRQMLAALRRSWEDSADAEFYTSAATLRSRFLRAYLKFDLTLRNAKAEYLNVRLGRPSGQDTVSVSTLEPDDETRAKVQGLLSDDDLLRRERGIDDAYWETIDEASQGELFSIDAILAFLAKLHIVERWLALDAAAGKEMFARLIREIRGTYGEVKYSETKQNKRNI